MHQLDARKDTQLVGVTEKDAGDRPTWKQMRCDGVTPVGKKRKKKTIFQCVIRGIQFI